MILHECGAKLLQTWPTNVSHYVSLIGIYFLFLILIIVCTNYSLQDKAFDALLYSNIYIS
jgi:hypothetical protein